MSMNMGDLGEFNIDIETLPQQADFSPVPAGKYVARCAKCELKETKAGTGKYLKFRWDIEGPTHSGRVVFGNITIANSGSPEAEEIGRTHLGALLKSIGMARAQDTQQFVGQVAEIKVVVRSDPVHGESNEIKGFSAVSGASPAQQKAPVFAAQKPGLPPAFARK